MNGPQSATVIFSPGPVADDFLDKVRRQEAVERGVESILAHIEGLRLVTSSNFACSASLAGPPDAMQRLKDYVHHAALGTVEFDTFEKPAFFSIGVRRS